MHIHHVTPILNVSDVGASIAWFEQLGWERGFTWNDGGSIEGAADANEHGPADFGSVRAGHAEIFCVATARALPAASGSAGGCRRRRTWTRCTRPRSSAA